MIPSRGSVLITEGCARAAVEVVRSFLRLGLDVHLATPGRWSAASYVRGLRRRIAQPSVTRQPEEFIDWLVKYLQNHKIDLCVPLGDVGAALVAEHQEAISGYTRVYIPPREVFRTYHDKILCNQAAAAAGVPIPQSWYLDETSLDAVISQARFPVLIKPAIGVGARGIVRAGTPAELETAWRLCGDQPDRCFVQECLPSESRQFCVEMLLDRRQQVYAAVASQKVRFFPVRGGASTLSKTIHCPLLCETAGRLLQSTDYCGVANVDFMEDPRDGQFKMLEVNPRFGEMHAICNTAGVDLPRMLWELAMGRDIEPQLDYREDICLRFIPTDLMWFLSSPDRFKACPALRSIPSSQIADTLYARHDWGPVVGYLLENLSLLANPKAFVYRFLR